MLTVPKRIVSGVIHEREKGGSKQAGISGRHKGIFECGNMTRFKIPGVTFSWKRALGITKIKQQIARETGIPTTKHGLERKIGGAILKLLKGK